MRRNHGGARRLSIHGAACAVALVLLAVSCSPPGNPPGTLTRPLDPVVMTGAQVSTLVGAPVGSIVAFHYDTAGWTQVPVQVDQRKTVELNTIYHKAANTTNPVNVLVYADPNTWAGAGSGVLGAQDEISFMSVDASGSAPSFSEPPNVVHNSGVKITVTDQRASNSLSFLYLYRQTGGLDPGAGKRYVDYQFKLTSGVYKTTYKMDVGPNPETSTVITPSYKRGFSDRWLDDGLSITAPGASGADILDRHKALFAPGNCGRSEDTFDAAEGAFIANINGPVRAIRSYIGANSGPYTERTQIYYAQREDITTNLRVHPIPSIMDFFDYSPAASGMTYTNDRNLNGVPIDGVPDTVAAGAPIWEKVAGSQGTLTHVWQLSTDVNPAPAETNYYEDNATNPVKQCTGDAYSYGSSGTYVTGAIPNTDPNMGPANQFTATHTLFFESPGQTNQSAPKHADQVLNPAQVSTTAWTG
ncbi:MAG: hypothetical protein M3Z46_04660 [Actinomycetota bacterium]|nr:hypothetical protein [Actinomycetota bacterium]